MMELKSVLLATLVSALVFQVVYSSPSPGFRKRQQSRESPVVPNLRDPKSLLEIREDKAMSMESAQRPLRRPFATAKNNNKDQLLSENEKEDIISDNDISAVPEQSSSSSLKSSSFTGGYYYCPPMGHNSNGNGMAFIRADPYDCSGYYYCVWGVYVPSKCTGWLLWNNKTDACDWFWNVDCGDRKRNNIIS